MVYTYTPITLAAGMLYGYSGGLNMEVQYETETGNKLKYGLVKFENIETLKVNHTSTRIWRVLPTEEFAEFEKHLTGAAFKANVNDELEPAMKVNWGSYSLNLPNGFPVFTFKVAVPQHPYLRVTSGSNDNTAQVDITKVL